MQPRFAVYALSLALALVAGCTPLPSGPMPEGERVMSGVVLYFDVDAAGETVVGELRGRKAKAGDLREQVSIARGPAWEGEGVGVGSMLGEVSDDGRWAVWLAAKERHLRMGPVRLRPVAGGQPFDAGFGMPPFLFDPAGTRAIWMNGYQAASGRGALVEVRLGASASSSPSSSPSTKAPSRLLVNDVLPGAFALLGDGTLLAIQTHNREACRAMAVGTSGAAARAIGAEGLDCEDPRPPFMLERDGRSALFRHAPDLAGRRRLSRWTPGMAGAATVVDDADAIAFDRDGALEIAAEEAGRVRLLLRPAAGGAPVEAGSIEGRFVRGLYPVPVPGGGAWIALADRRCDGGGSDAASPVPACVRLVAAGGAPAPPALGLVRRIVSAPAGWPIAVFAGPGATPTLLAIDRADAPPVEIGKQAIAVEFSPDGRHVAARLSTDTPSLGVEIVVLVNLATGARRELARGADEPGEIRWIGNRLFHAWRARKRMNDPRNGLYRVEP